jgi:hypothetical protein
LRRKFSRFLIQTFLIFKYFFAFSLTPPARAGVAVFAVKRVFAVDSFIYFSAPAGLPKLSSKTLQPPHVDSRRENPW